MTKIIDTLTFEKIKESGGLVPPQTEKFLPSIGTFSFTKISIIDLEVLAEATKKVSSNDSVGLVRALMVAVCHMDGKRIERTLVAKASQEDIESFAEMYIYHSGKAHVKSSAIEYACLEVNSSVETHHKLRSISMQEGKTKLEYIDTINKFSKLAPDAKWLKNNISKLFVDFLD